MTPRELATLIRKGAQLRPQGFGNYCREGKTCAIGAAAMALHPTITIESEIDMAAFKLANSLSESKRICTSEIFDMNDGGYTREQIADWLDTLDVSKPKDAQTFDDFMKATMVAVELEKPVRSEIDSLAK